MKPRNLKPVTTAWDQAVIKSNVPTADMKFYPSLK
jgi:hypothetical protein